MQQTFVLDAFTIHYEGWEITICLRSPVITHDSTKWLGWNWHLVRYDGSETDVMGEEFFKENGHAVLDAFREIKAFARYGV